MSTSKGMGTNHSTSYFEGNLPLKTSEKAIGICVQYIGIYIQSLLESTLEKALMGFYRDDGLTFVIPIANKRTQYEKVSEAVPSIIAQGWPWSSQVEV